MQGEAAWNGVAIHSPGWARRYRARHSRWAWLSAPAGPRDLSSLCRDPRVLGVRAERGSPDSDHCHYKLA